MPAILKKTQKNPHGLETVSARNVAKVNAGLATLKMSCGKQHTEVRGHFSFNKHSFLRLILSVVCG